ncbi:MAG: response regulator transcription factor [bacterium]|nr:response regulator transcription factor [bacterium]
MRILLIEDEHKIAAAIKKGLEQENLAVDLAYDGNEGFELSESESYDVIILDRMLPGIDGLKIAQKLSAEKNHTPILMLTAKGQLSDRVEGLNSGVDDYLVKPFAFEELLARVKALLRRPKDTIGTTLKIGNLSLNTITYSIKRNDTAIQLSSKEYALLEYLMRHPNQILTKEQIIAHVWDYDADILPNTVEVYIGYLRNKIDRPFKNTTLIHTVRGFGYKMGEE